MIFYIYNKYKNIMTSELNSIKLFCKTKNTSFLKQIKPQTLHLFYKYSLDPKVTRKDIATLVQDRYNTKTFTVCLKADSLRKNNYRNIVEWLNNPKNRYVGRNGYQFVTLDKILHKHIYKNIKNKYGDLIDKFHNDKFIKKIKPKKLSQVSNNKFGNLIITPLKNGSFNLSYRFIRKKDLFYNPFGVNKNMTIEESLKKFEEYMIKSGLVNKLELIRGQNLGCFCKENDPCHAKVLIKLLKKYEKL